MNRPPRKSLQSTIRPLEARPFGAIGSMGEPSKRVVVGRALQSLRERYFRLHPLCVRCDRAGRTTTATVIDHILALENGGLDVDANRQGLCHPCHVAKTNEDNMIHRALSEGANVLPFNRSAR